MRTPVAMGVLAALALASVFSARVLAAELLEALEECPAAESACLDMYAYLNWPGERSDSVEDHPAVSEVLIDKGAVYGHLVVRIRGRLNGAAARSYRLKLGYPTDALGCNDFRVSARGARKGGGGVILTRQGALEILSSDIEIGDRGSLIVIDLERGRNTARLSPGWEQYSWGADPVVTKDGRVLWRKKGNGICLDLETEEHFRRIAEENCVGGNISAASPEDIERVRRAGITLDARPTESDPPRKAEARDNALPPMVSPVPGDRIQEEDAYGSGEFGAVMKDHPFDEKGNLILRSERLQYDLRRLEETPLLIYVWGVACT